MGWDEVRFLYKINIDDIFWQRSKDMISCHILIGVWMRSDFCMKSMLTACF